jgi:hypothetical protein
MAGMNPGKIVTYEVAPSFSVKGRGIGWPANSRPTELAFLTSGRHNLVSVAAPAGQFVPSNLGEPGAGAVTVGAGFLPYLERHTEIRINQPGFPITLRTTTLGITGTRPIIRHMLVTHSFPLFHFNDTLGFGASDRTHIAPLRSNPSKPGSDSNTVSHRSSSDLRTVAGIPVSRHRTSTCVFVWPNTCHTAPFTRLLRM